MGPEVMIAIFVPLAFFALVFGIFYIRNRENMALIEKGINPRQQGPARPRPFVNLKYGLLFIGCGLGLLVAYIIDIKMLRSSVPTTTHVITHPSRPGGDAHKVVITGSSVHVERIEGSGTATADTLKDSMTTNQHLAVSGNKMQVRDNDEDEMDKLEVYQDNRREQENPAIYFALIAIGGGLGLVLSYTIEKKYMLDKPKVA